MNNDQSAYWIEVAEYDLETATAMLTSGRYLYVGFMCHQVIEKGFKSILADKGVMPPKIHKLDRLAELGNINTLLDTDQQSLIDKLAPLNIVSRYPEYKNKIAENLDECFCKDIIAQTEALLAWIKSKQ